MQPRELLAHLDQASLWPGPYPLELAAAYQSALAVRQMRQARGERPRGFKVGFTNRQIWTRYRVYAPIWGTVWHTTLSEGLEPLALAGFCQPRLEPETVFGLHTPPPPQASLQDLYDCIDWVAPGFEVVQSHCPDWVFEAADTVADGGLHGHLRLGAQQPVRELAPHAHALAERLSQAKVQLFCDGVRRETGQGAHVLDSPLHALQHFVQTLRACPNAPDLQAGDVVTTGTWTDAYPLRPGQHWCAQFDAPLGTLTLHVV